MGFFDWIGFTAAGVQSFFAWATFNRDAFVDNVQMRQNQMYQQKNYQISWIAIARDDVRDMMGISVNRINNYMLVATLILGVAAGAVLGVSFDDTCPDYLVYAFYLCACISIVFLMLAIMFGVKGQNCAFTNTMKLLTAKIRPENPADYNHDYMKQAQWIERNGLISLFRVPGMNPNYDTVYEKELLAGKRSAATTFAKKGDAGRQVSAPGESAAVSPANVCLEAATPLESLFKTSSHLWYLTKFTRFMELWKPFDNYSKFCMGLGIICLGQGSAYFALGRLVQEGRSLTYWAACVVTVGFVYMVVLVTTQNFKTKYASVRFAVNIVLMAGPLFAAAAAVTLDVWMDRICVPVSFLSHFAFWIGAFFMAQRQEDFTPQKLDFHNTNKKQEQEPPLAAAAAEAARAHGLARQGTAFHTEAPPPIIDDDDATADHWPTDEPEFDVRQSKTSFHIKRSVRHTLFMSAFLWGCMTIWAIARFIAYSSSDEIRASVIATGGDPSLIALDASADVSMKKLPVGVAERVNVAWPPLFRPSRVACAGGTIFLADRFGVFRLYNGAVTRVDCGDLDGPIVDVTAFCKGPSCEPLVLLRGAAAAPPRVIDCRTGNATHLLAGDGNIAEHLAVRASRPGEGLESQQLIVGHSGGDLVQYAWQARRIGWEPESYLGKLGNAEPNSRLSPGRQAVLRGIDAAVGDGGGHMLIFWGAGPSGVEGARDHDGATGKPIAVDVRDLSSMDRTRVWAVSREVGPLLDGCASQSGFAAYVLRDQGTSPGGTKPLLLHLRLT